jgi:hypothetical protein
MVIKLAFVRAKPDERQLGGEMLWTLLLGCDAVRGLLAGPPPVPVAVIEEIAPALSSLGHPQADFVDVTVEAWSSGEASEHHRWVDAAIRYARPNRPEPNTMVVRVYLEQTEPCRASVDVLRDDGPAPVLLDNGFAAGVFGEEVCEVLERPR